jgi:hypothetical protein
MLEIKADWLQLYAGINNTKDWSTWCELMKKGFEEFTIAKSACIL